MAGKLAFVEAPSQIADVPADHRVAALTPLAEVALEQEGRAFTRLEDYSDEMALLYEGIANFAKVEALCSGLDDIFADHVKEVAEYRLLPARWSYFWLRLVYDAFYLRASQLRQMLSAESPSQVMYFDREQLDLSREYISRSESIYSVLLDHILPRLDTGAVKRATAPERHAGHTGSEEVRPGGSLLDKTRQMAGRRLMQLRSASKVVRQRFRFPTGHRVLCIDYDYNTPYISDELSKLGLEVWVWRRDGLNVRRVGSLSRYAAPQTSCRLTEGQTKAIWRAVEGDRAIRDLFWWEGQDYWPVVAPRLARLVRRGLPDVLSYYMAGQNVVRRIRPDAIVTSMAAYPREKAVCHAARNDAIPVVVSQHGGLGAHKLPMPISQDVDSVDWALCWGRWEAECIRRHYKRKPRVAVVGAPMIEAARRAAPERCRIRKRLGYPLRQRLVLYVPTSLPGNHWYTGQHRPTDSSYFRHSRLIVQQLMKLVDWSIVVKEHPIVDESPLDRWIRSIDRAGRVSVIRRPSFAELIHLSDVVVLDFAYTTLVQALAGSGLVCIVNHPFHQWSDGVVEHLTRAGVVFCGVAELYDRIRNYRETLPYGEGPVHTGAIDPLAADHEKPNGAARRGAECIVQIIKRTRLEDEGRTAW